MVILYLFDKYISWHVYVKWNLWVLVLLLSLMLWQIALHLHSHPELVSGLFLQQKEEL